MIRSLFALNLMFLSSAGATSLPLEISDLGFRMETVKVRYKWQSITDITVGFFNVYGTLSSCQSNPVHPLLYKKERRDSTVPEVMRIEIQILSEKREQPKAACWDQKVLFGVSFHFCQWPAEVKRAQLIHEGVLLKEYVLPDREYQCL